MAETTETAALPAEQARELIDGGAQVVDVRGDAEFEAGHIPGARHVRLDRLATDGPDVARDRPVVFYCRSGDRSELAAEAFRVSGFDAHHVEGGLAAWHEAGLPLDPEGGEVAKRSNLPGD